MALKDSDDPSIDYGFISKYIKEDINDAVGDLFKKKFENKKSGATEVFGSVGEGSSYYPDPDSENRNFNDRKNEDDEGFETPQKKVESITKPMAKAKQEFFDNLKDESNESLSIDTCNQLNRDWKRR
jgi:hypothetical protein